MILKYLPSEIMWDTYPTDKLGLTESTLDMLIASTPPEPPLNENIYITIRPRLRMYFNKVHCFSAIIEYTYRIPITLNFLNMNTIQGLCKQSHDLFKSEHIKRRPKHLEFFGNEDYNPIKMEAAIDDIINFYK